MSTFLLFPLLALTIVLMPAEPRTHQEEVLQESDTYSAEEALPIIDHLEDVARLPVVLERISQEDYGSQETQAPEEPPPEETENNQSTEGAPTEEPAVPDNTPSPTENSVEPNDLEDAPSNAPRGNPPPPRKRVTKPAPAQPEQSRQPDPAQGQPGQPKDSGSKKRQPPGGKGLATSPTTEESWLETLEDNPVPIVGGVVLVAGAAGWFFWSRNKAQKKKKGKRSKMRGRAKTSAMHSSAASSSAGASSMAPRETRGKRGKGNRQQDRGHRGQGGRLSNMWNGAVSTVSSMFNYRRGRGRGRRTPRTREPSPRRRQPDPRRGGYISWFSNLRPSSWFTGRRRRDDYPPSRYSRQTPQRRHSRLLEYFRRSKRDYPKRRRSAPLPAPVFKSTINQVGHVPSSMLYELYERHRMRGRRAPSVLEQRSLLMRRMRSRRDLEDRR